MFCIYCGNRLAADDKFCVKCGKEVEKKISFNSKKVKKKPKSGKIVLITILSLILVLIIYIIGSLVKKNIEINMYKNKALEYLNEKYDESFNITFKGKEYGRIGTSFCGEPTGQKTNKDEEIFIYSFAPYQNGDIVCYIKVSHYIKKNTIEINEDISYEKALKCYNQKKEIEDKLNALVGIDYVIDMYSDISKITLTKDETFDDAVLNDVDKFKNMYNELYNLKKDKDISIYIFFKENADLPSNISSHNSSIGVYENTNYLDKCINRTGAISDIFSLMKDNKKYEMEFDSSYDDTSIQINFNNIYEDEIFDDIIKEYQKISDKYNYMVFLEFEDKTILDKTIFLSKGKIRKFDS